MHQKQPVLLDMRQKLSNVQMSRLSDSLKRWRTLQTGTITALPIVILMPHSGCNCRCIMCDIWKGNRNNRQLTREDIEGLLATLRKFNTQQVVMSGGEALLNPAFFSFCDILRDLKIKITLLTAGLSLERQAKQVAEKVNELIISLDGDETLHDRIRNIPGAFQKIRQGITAVRTLKPGYRITGRSVIQRNNFRHWTAIIDSARQLGLDQISFLPADVSSHAFNRDVPWDESRQQEILPSEDELPLLRKVTDEVICGYSALFRSRFIAESPEKLGQIHLYYSACYGINPYPYKKCNAPWVSAVIEADGAVRPCFFHPAIGNIRVQKLDGILNGKEASLFRKELDVNTNPVCAKCVCHLNLPPFAKI